MQQGVLVERPDQAASLRCLHEEKRAYFLCKRCVDMALSSVLLVVLLPIIAIIALLIKLDSRGSVFFAQERVGSRRRARGKRSQWEIGTFTCYKFRTMYHNADQRLHRVAVKAFARGKLASDACSKCPEAMFKLIDDPRVTRLGRMLRRTSLAEIPQFFNVLKGEMSLVGPRPVPLYEVAEYGEWHKERLAATPGVTGLWQVKGRSRVSLDEMARMDIEYVRNRSLLGDAKIILLTIPAVLSGKGAA